MHPQRRSGERLPMARLGPGQLPPARPRQRGNGPCEGPGGVGPAKPCGGAGQHRLLGHLGDDQHRLHSRHGVSWPRRRQGPPHLPSRSGAPPVVLAHHRPRGPHEGPTRGGLPGGSTAREAGLGEPHGEGAMVGCGSGPSRGPPKRRPRQRRGDQEQTNHLHQLRGGPGTSPSPSHSTTPRAGAAPTGRPWARSAMPGLR